MSLNFTILHILLRRNGEKNVIFKKFAWFIDLGNSQKIIYLFGATIKDWGQP